MAKPTTQLIHLNGCPIYRQLELEEALLRAHDENFCIINQGSNDAIVLGISSKPEEMIHLDQIQNHSVEVIKRFSGGGTVYVDPNTLFVTFICHKNAFPILPFPEAILKWGESIYQPAFGLKDFKLRENDYVVGHKKVGGNALYIRKDRWLLHTSFLWDYHVEKINLLKQPKKIPQYRKDRSHEDFITPLKQFYPDPLTLINLLKTQIAQTFTIQESFDKLPASFLGYPHRKTLKRISI